MKNLEIKVKINDGIFPDCNLFASESGTLVQKDTYYLLGERRLKLREEGDCSHLIFYVRADVLNSKESNYLIINIPGFLKSSLKKIMNIIFSEKAVVDKERKLFLYKHTRIHLDSVKSLGYFVELETVFNENISSDLFVKEHEEVKQNLRLSSFTSIPYSYSDLVQSLSLDTNCLHKK